MGKRGPAPTPNSIKILEGTYRRDMHGDVEKEPTSRVLDKVPAVPRTLSATAKKHWKEAAGLLLEMGILTTAELPSLIQYATAQDELADCDKDIKKNGWVQFNEKTGMEYDRPVVKRRAAAIDRIMRLFGRFGFTPSDRVGMQVEAPKPKASTGVGARKRG